MIRYSASKLKLYKTCKLKYDLYYNKEIIIDEGLTADTAFGLIIHEIAEKYDGNYDTIINIINEYKKVLNSEFIKLIPQTVFNMLTWLKKYQDKKSINEVELELKNDDYWLYGLADKLFPDGKIFVDYKTARSNVRENHIFQMRLYNLILSKQWKCNPKDIKCIIYYPRIDQEDKILFNNKEIELFEKELKKLILDIETNDIWEPTQGYHCKWCPYKKSGHCPL